MLMIACALLWAMILPEAPQGLINSQQTMLIASNTWVIESNNQGELPGSFS
jgi:hypothetical protein